MSMDGEDVETFAPAGASRPAPAWPAPGRTDRAAVPGAREPAARRRTLRRDVVAFATVAAALVALLFGLAMFWTGFAATRPAGRWWPALAVLSALVVAALAVVTVALLARHVLRLAIDPLQQLALAAVQISTSGQARIADADREDEVGELARALQAWKDAAAERQVLADGAPVGIARIDTGGRLLTANAAFRAMHGGGDAVVGLHWWALFHPEDRRHEQVVREALHDRHLDRAQVEARLVRVDGTPLWCSVTIAPLPGSDGRPESYIVILEDISERKGHAELAARIQQELLPHSAPEVKGYEVAAACLSALEVAGDFYDWILSDDGRLQITVADVMGKGMGAALVMATVRAVLRAAPASLSPAARVRLAADGMVGTESGLFVTLFHASLDPSSGMLDYVDAGHGYCIVLRPDGEVVRLPGGSLPLGVLPDEEFRQGAVRLDPGDRLLVYSDGLVETDEHTIEPGELVAGLDESMPATEVVRRLIARMPPRLSDDVTVVSLRRLSQNGRHAAGAARADPVPEGGAAFRCAGI
jgi:sigma-B regulation protein RsbU (phosphoserine phosphatase)